MKNIRAFIKSHPLLSYFALTFAISWGGFVLVVGPGGFPGTGSQFDTLMAFVVLAMLAGPSVAGLLLTGLVDGKAGLRELLSRLLRCVAQLTAYRVLMVWVYDRTGGSLLVAMLMHTSLIVGTIFIFTPLATGVAFLTYTWVLAASLWVVVGAVAVVNRGHLSRQPLRGRLEKGTRDEPVRNR